MLLFSFLVTVIPKNAQKDDESKNIIYEYFNLLNSKDISSIREILIDPDDTIDDLDYISNIKLESLKKEDNNSIIKSYLKYNQKEVDNIRVYKVKYNVAFNKNAPKDTYIDGAYESWVYLSREDNSSKWFIDVFDI